MKTEDEIMKELLMEELEREVAEIKKKIEQDPSLYGEGPDPALKNKIWQKAEELRKQKEIYQNLSEADKEALRLGRELQLRREEKAREEISEELVPELSELAAGAEDLQKKEEGEMPQKTRIIPVKKRRKKVVIALAAALVAVLGLGITSFGDPGYVAETVNRILGGRQTTNITSESENIDITKQEEIEEEIVFQQIKDEFGFEPIRLTYKPKKMQIIDYMLETEFLTANLYYSYKNNIITYVMMPSYQKYSFGYDIEDQIVDEYTKIISSTKVHITEYLILESNEQEFSAQFEYKNIDYILTGIIEKEEFEKILENLYFF